MGWRKEYIDWRKEYMDWKKEYISCEKGICNWAEKRIFIFEKKMIRRLNGARR